MELEIGIEDILKKERIESDRIEFKEGWNPDDIYRSICAFANDYNNEGGGYIIVGVRENEGMAVRPVKGIPENKLDEIQREMLSYNNKMAPTYFPKVVPVQVDKKWILVIIARTGQQRPYKVPEYVTSRKDKKWNRRLGEFLKELDLSEGHSTGIPTIQDELKKNGSPRAEFFTDEDRRATRIRFPFIRHF